MNFYVLLIVLTSLISFYLIGSILSLVSKSEFEKDVFFDVFIKLTIGLLFVVFTYAVIVTGGNTILWGFVILGLFYLFEKKGKAFNIKDRFFDVINKNNKRQFVILLVMIVGIVFFFFQGSFFYNQPINNVPHGDFNYYALLIEYLNLYGVESTTFAQYLIIDTPISPVPYHYPELWLSALISKVFGILAMETQVVATHSILATILGTGMIALSRKLTNSFVLQIFSFLSIFLSGVFFLSILPQSETFIFANGYNPKTVFVSLFFIWFVILALDEKQLFYFPLLFLPIANIALAPAILTSLILYSIINTFNKSNKIILSKHIIFETFIIAIFIMSFYFFQSGSQASGGFQKDSLIEGLLIDRLKPLKIFFGSILIFISLYGLYLLPIIAVLISKQRKDYYMQLLKYKNIFIIFVFVFLSGLFMWSLTHPISDSIQFFYMPALILLNLVIVINLLFVYKSFEKFKSIKYIFLSYIFIILSINLFSLQNTPFYKYREITKEYSEKYIKTVVELTETHDYNNKIIVFITPPNEHVSFWHIIKNNGPAIYFRFYKPYFNTLNLNSLDRNLDAYDAINKKRIEKILHDRPFYKFAISRKENYSSADIPTLQYEFIVENKIKYLILEKGAELDTVFKSLVDTIVLDEISKQKFVFLKY